MNSSNFTEKNNIKKTFEFQPFPSTVEDVFVANIENDRGSVEQLRIYDTAGLGNRQLSLNKIVLVHN